MNEWRELKTLQEVAEAQKNGEEIEIKGAFGWFEWSGSCWSDECAYRSRPRKKTKTIVLREALILGPFGHYFIRWCSDCDDGLVRWLDTPPREIEVPDAD